MNPIVISIIRSNLVFSALEDIEKQSKVLLEKKKTSRFLEKSKDSQKVVTLVEQLRTAIVYYQVGGNCVN